MSRLFLALLFIIISSVACHSRPPPIASKPVNIGGGFIPPRKYDCRPLDRKKPCLKKYAPVCGYNTPIQCLKPLCSIPKTYFSGCEACADPTVTFFIAGACPEKK
jgi:hypothetical protein